MNFFPRPQSPDAEPHKDVDADLAGQSLVTPPPTPTSVNEIVAPEEEADIGRLEARLRELLAERRYADTTDEPIGEINAAEVQRLSVRINELRAQQRKRLDGIGEE